MSIRLKLSRLVYFFMYEGHGMDPADGVIDGLPDQRVLYVLGLQVQQAGDDLHVVFDAVMYFLDQDGFFLE